MADILLGRINPSGKPAETFLLRLEDTPWYPHYPGDKTQVRYGESIFVGYRGFDIRKMPVRFPFGHDGSYTTLDYRDFTVTNDGWQVSCTAANTGDRASAEVVQLYIHDSDSSVARPEQGPKAFEEVALEPGETRAVTFPLDRRSYAFWHPVHRRCVVEAGEFEIRIGSSSRDIRLNANVTRPAEPQITPVYVENTMFGDALVYAAVGPYLQPIYDVFLSSFGDYEPGSAEAREHSVRLVFEDRMDGYRSHRYNIA